MEQRLGDHIKACYERSSEFEASAEKATDPALKAQYLELAGHWKLVARNYEFAASLEDFLLESHKRGWPIKDIPRPPQDA